MLYGLGPYMFLKISMLFAGCQPGRGYVSQGGDAIDIAILISRGDGDFHDCFCVFGNDQKNWIGVSILGCPWYLVTRL